MKITSLSVQKNNKEKYNVYIDGIYSFSAEAIDVIKYSVQVDKELNEAELNSLILTCEASKAFNYTLNLIDKRDYTSKEIEKKLFAKGYNQNTIILTINKLKSLDMINDNNYADRYIKDSMNIKKQGKKKIFYDLYQKGISKEDLSSFEIDSEQEYDNAYCLVQKKYQSIKDKPNVKEKLFRYLISKGYDYEVAKKAINDIVKSEEVFI